MLGSKFPKMMAALAALVMCGASTALAVPLPPSGNILLPPPGPLLGVQIATTGTQVFSAPSIAGTAVARVFREVAGTLDFVYDFSVSAASLNALESATMSQFGNSVIYDATFVAGTGVAPTQITRDASGNVVKFFFPLATGVPAGQSSDTLILRTTATDFVPGLYSVQDGSTANLIGFQPVAVQVPEPATAGIGLALGLPLLGGFLWSKSKKKDEVTA